MSRKLALKGVFSAAPVIVDLSGIEPPIAVTVIPGPGCVCRCESSRSAGSAERVWLPWPLGDIGTPNEDLLVGPVAALRFTRVAGAADCRYEVLA